MFWTIVWIVLGILLIPTVIAFSEIPQEDKPSKKVVIAALAVAAILPGINVLVFYTLVVYGLVKVVNAYLKESKHDEHND